MQEYQEAILHYSRLIRISSLARHPVRTLGVCTATVEKFESQSLAFDLNIAECQFAGEIIDFLQEQSCKTVDIGTFIGSSEIIESFFGKFKSMEGDQCKSGFTGLVLAAHAHVGTLDEEIVATALSSVSTKKLKRWIKDQVGTTIQSKRKSLFNLAEEIFKNKIGEESCGISEGEVMGF